VTGSAARAAVSLLDQVQRALFAASRDFCQRHTFPVTDYRAFEQRIGEGGLFVAAWSGTTQSERAPRTTAAPPSGASSTSLRPRPSVSSTGMPAQHTVMIGRAY
jgi:prolyl-tRNA synthetase